jgi:hypothetical protein
VTLRRPARAAGLLLAAAALSGSLGCSANSAKPSPGAPAAARAPEAPDSRAEREAMAAAACSRQGQTAPVCCVTAAACTGTARHPGRNGCLTPQELEMAKIAWRYFENNEQKETGLVNAVDGYPSTTMWDTASYLGALIAAHRLCLISSNEFDRRAVALLGTLGSLSLFRGELPNKVYNTKTAEKVNYGNAPGEIGFSALDLGRLLIWLRILREDYPEHGNAADRVVMRWNFCHAVDACGTLFGAYVDKDKATVYAQEGRLGYEEYSAKGFDLWGVPAPRAALPEPYAMIPIYGIDIPYDTRDPRELKAHNYVVSESYILDGVELNWDLAGDHSEDDMHHSNPWMADFAGRIYRVQEARYQATGIVTARTEHQLDSAPYFVYDTIFSDGFPWNTITEEGQYSPRFAAIAIKGALGLWVLWDTPYTDLLFRIAANKYDPAKGFYEGIYEDGHGLIKTFTANNNGILLELLLYKVEGKLLRFSGAPSLWEHYLVNERMSGAVRCVPRGASCKDPP